jgi:hypothetical protein
MTNINHELAEKVMGWRNIGSNEVPLMVEDSPLGEITHYDFDPLHDANHRQMCIDKMVEDGCIVTIHYFIGSPRVMVRISGNYRDIHGASYKGDDSGQAICTAMLQAVNNQE